ncbi:site-2 protease family protein [Propionivibrio dicarboxylicus]|uniref:Zn-dependent protease (Includes SpoIVFB) n=1 Tax=Propionivibrio dicarboxylicus TaxID=83767 RepID=A0A1G7Y3B2_9RHOO|nr:site-2 protease family protein [Propionivibrio dicarboxylicus]SDG90962.1 Zn-dependent protease (includes SpoIVFB) [Propionivibrio dicarboxylicus]
MEFASIIQTLSIAALPVVLAITLHEAAHGYAARYFGDPTAWLAGRISLNPLRHVELFGTILLPILLYLVNSPFLFGWAKPVPVDFSRLRHPKRDMLWVAAAGPAVNLVMALGWAALLKVDTLIPVNQFSYPLALMCQVGIGINLALMALNLIPLPPLDGGRIAVSLLPWSLAIRFARLERWGFFILLALMYFNVLDVTVWPLVSLLKQTILSLFQLN